MIDLHCHLLPGIDDGAADLDESVAMGRLAAAEGTTLIVATPHLRQGRFWNAGRATLEALAAEVAQRLEGIVEVRLGGEIAAHSESFEEMLELPGGDLLTLAGSRYVLVEVPWQPVAFDVMELVHELTVRDLVPILAHPERVRWLAEDPPLLAALRRAGALLQLTGASVTGELGSLPQRVSKSLLDAGMADLVASDGHSPAVRPPGLGAVYRQLREERGEETARRLLIDNPGAVVADRPVGAVLAPALR